MYTLKTAQSGEETTTCFRCNKQALEKRTWLPTFWIDGHITLEGFFFWSS